MTPLFNGVKGPGKNLIVLYYLKCKHPFGDISMATEENKPVKKCENWYG